MIFNPKKVSHYIFAVGIIFVVSSMATKIKGQLNDNDDYETIRKYVLNESPLYGYNRPKLWVHSKYEVNSRNWKKFQNRNSTDLNQPYLHLTIKSIINHCGQDFNICLIDDSSFSKLLPSWDIDITTLPEPTRSQFRELGMVQLIQKYGGMIVPNSFVCVKNLKPLYEENIENEQCFILEKNNKTCDLLMNNSNQLFIPDIYFMGAEKNNETVTTLVNHIKKRNQNHHSTEETHFKGEIANQCLRLCKNQQMNIVDGGKIGIKDENKKPVIIDELMGESFINFDDDLYGIYIPSDEILKRKKFEWFASRSSEDVLNSKTIISKYLKSSVVDYDNEFYQSGEITSVVSI